MPRLAAVILLLSLPIALLAATGEEVYAKRCASCHDQTNPRIPPRESLKKIPATRILKVLDFGVMMQIAYQMTRQDREAVAKFLGTDSPESVLAPEAFCKDRTVAFNDKSKFIWNGWSPKPDNARFQTAEVAGLSIDQVRKLKLKWAFGYEGDVNAFAQPAFFDGQIFVGSARGTIHALRAESGCVQWTFDAKGPVRSAMVVVPNGNHHAVLLFWRSGSGGITLSKPKPEGFSGARNSTSTILRGSPARHLFATVWHTFRCHPGKRRAPVVRTIFAAPFEAVWSRFVFETANRFGKATWFRNRPNRARPPREKLNGVRPARASGRLPCTTKSEI